MRFRSLSVLAMIALLPLVCEAAEPRPGMKLTPLMKTTTTWDGAPIHYPDGKAEITGVMIEMAPGTENGWHEHPVPTFGMLLEGTLEVTLADGKVKRIEAGEALAEVMNTVHNGRNIGKGPLKLLVFYAGAVDTPVTVPRPDAAPKSN